jgi:hypothetical protein
MTALQQVRAVDEPPPLDATLDLVQGMKNGAMWIENHLPKKDFIVCSGITEWWAQCIVYRVIISVVFLKIGRLSLYLKDAIAVQDISIDQQDKLQSLHVLV